MPLYHEIRRNRGPKEDGYSAGLDGGIFSRITTLLGTAVEAARSSEGIFTSLFCFCSCFHVGECPVDKAICRQFHETRPKVKKEKGRLRAPPLFVYAKLVGGERDLRGEGLILTF